MHHRVLHSRLRLGGRGRTTLLPTEVDMISGDLDKLDQLYVVGSWQACVRTRRWHVALLAAAGLAIGMLCMLFLMKPAPPSIRIIDAAGDEWLRSSKPKGLSAGSQGQPAQGRERGSPFGEAPGCKKPQALRPRLLVQHAGDPAKFAAGEIAFSFRHRISFATGAEMNQAAFPPPETSNMKFPSATELVEAVSSEPFTLTIDRLTAAIHRAGLSIFARIDHAAAASESGLHMPPTMVLVYGHAKGGTPIMLAAPRAALQLPLRVLVREGREGQVIVSFEPVGPLLRAMGVPAELLGRLEPAQRLILDALQMKAHEPT